MVKRNRRVFVVGDGPIDKVNFDKPAQTFDYLLQKVSEQGLIIDDEARARRALSMIGYYRLLIYMRRFQKRPEKTFVAGSRFSDILDFYEFDRSIRLSCLDAIERIEVCLRSILSNEIAIAHGPHWFINRDLFSDKKVFDDLINHIEHFMGSGSVYRHYENGISHYHTKYGRPSIPPCWTTFEHLAFSRLSRILAALARAERTKVARQFDLPEKLIVSWIHTISDFRNCCAHHERLINRRFKFSPVVPKSKGITFFNENENKGLYARIIIIIIILKGVDLHLGFRDRMRALFLSNEEFIDERDIPLTWLDHAIWK